MLKSVKDDLRDWGWEVYGYKRIRAVKSAEKINVNREMYGFNQMYGIRDIEFIT